MDGDNDWGYGRVEVNTYEGNRLLHQGIFTYEGDIGDHGDRKDSTGDLIVDHLRGKRPSRGGRETIVLKEDWVVLNNLEGSEARPMKETISLTLDTGMWSEKTQEKTQSTEVTVGLASTVMGVDVSSELKASTETTVSQGKGDELNFSKSSQKEIEEPVPAATLVMKLARWEVQGSKLKWGNLVQWIPDPTTLNIAYSETTDYIPDPNGSGRLVGKVSGQPIRPGDLAIIEEKAGGRFRVPVVHKPQPAPAQSSAERLAHWLDHAGRRPATLDQPGWGELELDPRSG